jgi:uncharacterized protein (DUF2235 family)
MSKNIVLCLDGTWNGPDVKTPKEGATPTNVQKLFEGLSGSAPLLSNDNEKEVAFPAAAEALQIAKYIHGIGNTTNVLAHKFEGAFGSGTIARIVRGYTFLSRNYLPGDRIYIVGFSRGAYTARALAGFVALKGLLDWHGMELVAETATSYSAGIAAWQQYRNSLPTQSGILRRLAGYVTDISDRIAIGNTPSPPLKFVTAVPIAAVGVWDTVGALGIPALKDENGTLIRKDEFDFADTSLNPAVARGFHAIAVDERRLDYTPTLWDVRDGVLQVLFPGAHADVGGGYAINESGLSNCALAWMANQLSVAGVLLANLVVGATDARAISHQPWAGVPFATASREFPPTLHLSQRVLQRISDPPVPLEHGNPASYRPQNLLHNYIKDDWSGPAVHALVEP